MSVSRRMDKQIVIYLQLKGTDCLFMQHHEWISKTSCWVKEALDKRIHALWLHYMKFWSRQNWSMVKKMRTQWSWGEINWKGAWGNFLNDNVLHFDRVLGYTSVCISQTHWIVVLMCAFHFVQFFPQRKTYEQISNFCQWYVYWNVLGWNVLLCTTYFEMHTKEEKGWIYG